MRGATSDPFRECPELAVRLRPQLHDRRPAVTGRRPRATGRRCDLAVLKLALAPRTALPAALILSPAPRPTETQRIFILGFPFGEAVGKQVTVSESSVSSVRAKKGVVHEIQVNGGMHPGNSGRPVLDTAGEVIGVAVAGIPGTQIQFAVPAGRAGRSARREGRRPDPRPCDGERGEGLGPVPARRPGPAAGDCGDRDAMVVGRAGH